MAFGHGKDSVGIVHGYDLTSYLRSMGVPRSADAAEASTFGMDSKEYLAGMKDGTISGEGLFDGSATGADLKLAALLGVEDRVMSYFPQGDAFGKPGYSMLAEEVSYEITADIGDAVGFTFEGQADGGAERVYSLLARATAISATGNQSTLDNLAATTAGGSAFLHGLSKVGGTTADVTIRHSTDNFVASDDLLASFTQISAGGVAQRVEINGTIRRYVRAVVTLGGGGTWHFSIQLHRN